MKPPRTDALQGTKGQLKYFLEQMAKVLAGNISFGLGGIQAPTANGTTTNKDPSTNVTCYFISGTTPTPANTPFTLSAGAGATFFRDGHKVVGWWVVDKIGNANIWRDNTIALSNSSLTLISDAANIGFLICII